MVHSLRVFNRNRWKQKSLISIQVFRKKRQLKKENQQPKRKETSSTIRKRKKKRSLKLKNGESNCDPRSQLSRSRDMLPKKVNAETKKMERREASRTAAQERREKIRQQTRERVRKYHEKQQTAAQEDNRVDSPGFANRTSKKRATDKVKK